MAAQKAPRRKAFALKTSEGTPLFRRDIQYDFLFHIFQDDRQVFLCGSGDEKATFRDVYVRALMGSPRIAKGLREKMHDSPAFATDFAMVSLLANVGRINTTMTFLPEMRTNLRSYHPVPSLQKVDPNLQDAPRIKNILKACHLAGEADTLPVTPAELRTKIAGGSVPSTNVVNLLFVLSNHCTFIASEHFGRQDVDLLDFFTPVSFSSSSRARAFLWLVYHYYQCADGASNPFANADGPSSNLATIPPLGELTQAEQDQENIDTPDEVEYGEKMRKFRVGFLARTAEDAATAAAEEGGGDAKGTGKGKGKGRGKKSQIAAVAASATGSAAPTPSPKGKKRPHAEVEPKQEDVEMILSSQTSTKVDSADNTSRPAQRRRIGLTPGLSIQDALTAPRPPAPVVPHAPRYTPAEIAARSGRQRTVFQQALHVYETIDPLADSDDEADDAARHSYDVKLQVLREVARPDRGRKTRVHERTYAQRPNTSVRRSSGGPRTSVAMYAPEGRRDVFERQSSVPHTYDQRRSSFSEHQPQRRPSIDLGPGSSYEYYGSRHGFAPEPRSHQSHHAHHDPPVFSYDQPVYARRRPSVTDPRAYERRSSIVSEHEGMATYSLPGRRPSLAG
ncbi:hypothetical protein PENSPDRAFT_597586 [Peniophora sp. CONT]|nr:hypothetical protein PENSPDRAFT_597586 [Peniophora sp. CONT]